MRMTAKPVFPTHLWVLWIQMKDKIRMLKYLKSLKCYKAVLNWILKFLTSVQNTFVGTLDPDERQNTDAKISQEFEVLQGSPELDFEVSNQCSEHICGYFGSR
eukprot:400044_1